MYPNFCRHLLDFERFVGGNRIVGVGPYLLPQQGKNTPENSTLDRYGLLGQGQYEISQAGRMNLRQQL
jgi:hypothetical protein